MSLGHLSDWMYLPFVREWVHGGWYILCLSTGLLFMYYTYIYTRREGVRDVVTQGCIALAVFLIGSGIQRAWFWLQTWEANRGYDTKWFEDPVPMTVLISSTMLAAWGIFCLLRVMAPQGKSWVWVLPLSITLIFLAVTAYL